MGITNSQYDAVMRVYEKRRNDNHHVEEERRKTAYKAIPELGELDRAVASLSVKMVKHVLMDKSASPDSLKTLLKEAAGGVTPEERRKKLLSEHGFPEDYLDPVYSCRECRDTGWIGPKHCRCFEREIVSLFYSQSGLSGILEKENFDTFRLDWYRENLIDEKTKKSSREIMASALNTCRTFAQDFGQGVRKDNLLLSGPVGLGKTFLTRCIAKELIEKGFSVIYFSAGELFDILAKDRFRRGQEDEEETFDGDYLAGCDLLIIDDLGTELTNSFVGTSLFQLLNTRILRGKGTVISTNLSPLEISRIYSDRISSRIMEHFSLIRVFGEDIRVRKRLGKHLA